jgi:hypothetical protein
MKSNILDRRDNMSEEWLPMRTVAKRLNVNYNTLSRLVALGQVETRNSPIDRRVKLVEVNAVKKIFSLG